MKTSGLIKKLRTNAGLTQQEVAKQLHLTRSTYAAIEDGRELKLNEIKNLAELYQIAPGDLIDGKIAQTTPAQDKGFFIGEEDDFQMGSQY